VTIFERQSFDVPGLGHGSNPVPVAARVGDFPNPQAWPSRQVLIYEHLGANVLVQCDALAVAVSRPRADL
jgi:hypothetical protein